MHMRKISTQINLKFMRLHGPLAGSGSGSGSAIEMNQHDPSIQAFEGYEAFVRRGAIVTTPTRKLLLEGPEVPGL